ncbi:hypothetical protein [Streptomyces sp. NBC_00158]|uniref:hypothetical protein n=1 Tax=Streptomyces sp. NBC_00158 TaxID=2903627 RepID=UPI00324AE4B4
MSEHRQHRWSRTPPARTADEDPDRAAHRPGDTTPDADADGHTAKRQRPGIGREEQVRPHVPPYRPRPERESDGR